MTAAEQAILAAARQWHLGLLSDHDLHQTITDHGDQLLPDPGALLAWADEDVERNAYTGLHHPLLAGHERVGYAVGRDGWHEDVRQVEAVAGRG